MLVDLQGPKIRIGKFRGRPHHAARRRRSSCSTPSASWATSSGVGLDYKNLPKDVRAGDTLLLDDGRIVLGVTGVRGSRISTVVEQGGVLSNNKGINRRAAG